MGLYSNMTGVLIKESATCRQTQREGAHVVAEGGGRDGEDLDSCPGGPRGVSHPQTREGGLEQSLKKEPTLLTP